MYMDEIKELYALIKLVEELIVQCQQNESVPMGQTAVFGFAVIKLTTLDVNQPLDILTPARELLLRVGLQAQTAGNRKLLALKPHGDLSSVVRQARQHVADAVDRRWFRKRYHTRESEKTHFVFDMQMALHPTTAGLEDLKRVHTRTCCGCERDRHQQACCPRSAAGGGGAKQPEEGTEETAGIKPPAKRERAQVMEEIGELVSTPGPGSSYRIRSSSVGGGT